MLLSLMDCYLKGSNSPLSKAEWQLWQKHEEELKTSFKPLRYISRMILLRKILGKEWGRIRAPNQIGI